MWSAPPGAWETWRRCNPADAGAVTFPARAQLPRRCPRAEGAPRRAGPPGRAATPTDTDRRRPPCPPTCSPNLRRQQALPGSHDTGNVAAVTPASGALPRAWWPNRSPSRESPTFPRKGPAHGGRWVAPDGRRTRPREDPDRRAALTPRLSRASAWEPAPGPAGRGDPDTSREGGSWEDLLGQLREKARSSAIPEARTQAAQRAGPSPGRT